jgi:CubicO group peptidase (beta-lactamase class C family)
MMQRIAGVALVFCVWVNVSPAAEDPLPRARPESVGVSSEKLERIGQVMRAEVDQGRMAGMVVGIARKGRLVYHEAFGYLDKTANTPMPRDALFSIASMTKPMTTVAAMMLHEEAKLMLMDPVGKYFPQLMNNRVAVMKKDASGAEVIDTVPARRPMNIQDLMRHTAGISYGGRGSTVLHKQYPQSSNSSGRAFSATDFIDKLDRCRCFSTPARRGITVCQSMCWGSRWKKSPARHWGSFSMRACSSRWA